MSAAGGAKGIGLACASCLGHEGARVVVADIDDVAASRHVALTVCCLISTQKADMIIPAVPLLLHVARCTDEALQKGFFRYCSRTFSPS